MQIDQTFAFLIILAADHLEINGLLDLACKTVGKSPQEVGRYAVTHQRCYYP
jgi:hypothetical protein